MGREIRRVPKNWEHPKDQGHFKHLYDEDYDSAAQEWIAEFLAWKPGNPDYDKYGDIYPYFWDYHSPPPDKEYYRPKWTDEERTHYQVYETVSEGTPISPVFATKEELVEYLVKYGTFWEQKYVRDGYQTSAGWDREAAEAFAKAESAPSMIVFSSENTKSVMKPNEKEFWNK